MANKIRPSSDNVDSRDSSKENLHVTRPKALVETDNIDVLRDGTTTATILMQAILNDYIEAVSTKSDPKYLIDGIDKAVSAANEAIGQMSLPCADRYTISQVAATSADNDEIIGTMIAEALEKAGKDGVIMVKEATSLETSLDVVDGLQFDRGYLSPYFITDPDRMEVSMEDPYILLTDRKVSSMKDLLPVLESVAKTGKGLFIVAEEVDGEALASLVVNTLRGTPKVAAVKAPGYGAHRKAMLEDIAVLTGCQVITDDLGIKLESVTVNELGTCRRIVVDKNRTTIIAGASDKEKLGARVKQIRTLAAETTSDDDREKLQERLAKLISGVAVINVGAATEVEMKEKKARVEDALHVTLAAIKEGIVAGGGVALLRASQEIENLQGINDDQDVGIGIVRQAMKEPLRQIVLNAGEDASLICNRVAEGEGNFGYDVVTGEFGNLVGKGIVDPAKIVRTALQRGASIAGAMTNLETSAAFEKNRFGADTFPVHHNDLVERISRGLNSAADAVKITLGPMGKKALLDKSFGAPSLTKDGVTTVREVELEGDLENMGAALLKEAIGGSISLRSCSVGDTNYFNSSQDNNPRLEFVLEGAKAKGLAIRAGSQADLIFRQNAIALVTGAEIRGKKLDEMLKGSHFMDITVTPDEGLAVDGWQSGIARFKDGALQEPVVFKIEASSNYSGQSGVHIELHRAGARLYEFKLAIEIVTAEESFPEGMEPRVIDLDAEETLLAVAAITPPARRIVLDIGFGSSGGLTVNMADFIHGEFNNSISGNAASFESSHDRKTS